MNLDDCDHEVTVCWLDDWGSNPDTGFWIFLSALQSTQPFFSLCIVPRALSPEVSQLTTLIFI
jgi:hypothetical protein